VLRLRSPRAHAIEQVVAEGYDLAEEVYPYRIYVRRRQ